MLGLIPNSLNLVVQILVEWISIAKREDYALNELWVGLREDAGLIESHEVVVQAQTSWKSVLDHNLSDLQEEVRDLRILVVEFLRSLKTAAGLVGLKDE